MNIKVTGRIEKPVEVNPLDVIRELKIQLLGINDYFIGDDGQVYRKSLYSDYENVLANDNIQKKVDLVRALSVLINELS